MDSRIAGLILLWLGTVLLVAVLQHRLRHGAWSAESFDHPHPVGRWAAAIAAIGMVMAAVGVALTLWGLG